MSKPFIAILGAGESGTGAAVLAAKKGFDVFVSDKGKIQDKYQKILRQYKIEFESEKHSEALILKANEIIKSPGIPDKSPIMQAVFSKSIPVISEIEFANRYTNARKIGITGSNGKTTTTLLTYYILKQSGMNVGLAGNVGKSFALQVAENNFDTYVLELSSFQLDYMFTFKADIAAILNITPDHMDWYNNDMQKYINSKFSITNNQTKEDYCIYNIDDNNITTYLSQHQLKGTLIPFSTLKSLNEGAYKNDKQIIYNIKGEQLTMEIEKLGIKGIHNVYNSMAAGIAARLIEIRKESIKQSLASYKNIEHRLELVAKVHGIEFINDSKATNVNSTYYALECQKKPVIWIAGGQDKGNDYSILYDIVKEKVKAIVCLGIDNSKIHEHFEKIVPQIVNTSSASDAVATAYKLGKPGDVVLLSPACASFDLFLNYEDRGNQFKTCVKNL